MKRIADDRKPRGANRLQANGAQSVGASELRRVRRALVPLAQKMNAVHSSPPFRSRRLVQPGAQLHLRRLFDALQCLSAPKKKPRSPRCRKKGTRQRAPSLACVVVNIQLLHKVPSDMIISTFACSEDRRAPPGCVLILAKTPASDPHNLPASPP